MKYPAHKSNHSILGGLLPWGFPGSSNSKESASMWETWVWSLGWKDLLENGKAPTPVFLPRQFHGQRILVGYSPWSHRESDMAEWFTLAHLLAFWDGPRSVLSDAWETNSEGEKGTAREARKETERVVPRCLLLFSQPQGQLLPHPLLGALGSSAERPVWRLSLLLYEVAHFNSQLQRLLALSRLQGTPGSLPITGDARWERSQWEQLGGLVPQPVQGVRLAPSLEDVAWFTQPTRNWLAVSHSYEKSLVCRIWKERQVSMSRTTGKERRTQAERNC